MTPESIAEELCPVIHAAEAEVEREVAKYVKDRRLRPEEIVALVQRFIDCADSAEKEKLREAIFRDGTGD